MITFENSRLAAGRLEAIRQILRQRHIVRVDELCASLGVSAATVRRDLLALDRQGRLRRVHGGAVGLDGSLEEPLFEDKTRLAAREKERIARTALSCIKPTDSVFLDGGSTVLTLAHRLTGMTQLTVVTNSLRVAAAFAAGGPRMIVTGGEFRRLSQTLVGPLTRPLIEQLRVDTAFIGTIGLNPRDGLTTTDPREAQTKEAVMARAERVVLLADSSKIGKVSFVRFGSLDGVDLIITDRKAPAAAVRALRKKGVKVLAV
jgi:DeoR family transcriptional regulator, fructose operon transcriptional repressor